MKPLLVLFSLLVVSFNAGAQNWIRTAGPVEDDVLDLCIDSNGTLYAVTPFGVNRSTDGGALWTRPFLFPASTTAGRITIAPNGAIIASSNTEVFVAADSGSPFIIQGMTTGGRVKHFATSGSGRIFASHTKKFIFSDDNGFTWDEPGIQGMLREDVHSFAVAASHDTVISHHQYLYASFNNGASWDLHHGFDVSLVKQVLIHPNGMWICLLKKGLVRYELTGDWFEITGAPRNTEYHTIDAMRNGSMFVSSSAGTYLVRDTSIWIDVTEGLARDDSGDYFPINRFIEDPKTKTYYAATKGAGVWKSSPLLGRDTEPRSRSLSVIPNPFIDRTTLYVGEASSWADIELRNILGAVVWKDRKYAASGTVSIDVQSIPVGNYLLIFRTSERTETQWVTLVK